MPRFEDEEMERIYEEILDKRAEYALEVITRMMENNSRIADWCLEVKIPEHSEGSE